jgi:hypothetical protein
MLTAKQRLKCFSIVRQAMVVYKAIYNKIEIKQKIKTHVNMFSDGVTVTVIFVDQIKNQERCKR